MKDFKNSTKMQMGHNFTRTTVTVPMHQRALPVRKPAMDSQGSDQPMVDSMAPPAMAKGGYVAGLSPTGYPPRPARITLKATGKTGVRKPRMSQLSDSDGDETMLAKGGHITAAKRKGLPKSEFGLPGERKYPVDTRARAANAKARATQQVNAGNLSPSSKAKIDAKADRVLHKAKGGSVRDPRSPMIPWKSGC